MPQQLHNSIQLIISAAGLIIVILEVILYNLPKFKTIYYPKLCVLFLTLDLTGLYRYLGLRQIRFGPVLKNIWNAYWLRIRSNKSLTSRLLPASKQELRMNRKILNLNTPGVSETLTTAIF